ncbi:uveal autoantigen with coiled-coil domains and ankyrin repeats isoform X4 [Phyllopteryx taeniolatus]|uniref:uveal autoantigen with coiled-coil domains and ankyrin repeats isoform X4 n=1 Tax=Phyllopteryx taeniolatus TaxID=161469 RepID=UPI002AD29B36|nr:uveal autoantigen with coiled-coil domains and ankyrin repeats isoform X4 [Phyllopteryx taeniolatus]
MKSLKYRLKKHEVNITNTDWNKYDDRLMKAVERGEVDKAVSVLSKKGIIPTKLDVEGRSAFHLAATRGHLDCLNLILSHSADVTATDATGKNALHLASRNGHSLCVQKLLQHNCPVGNVDLQGRTALHDAVMAGCSSSVKLLCDSGASVNASDFDGRTPLVLATQMCHPRICQLLLERGADIAVRDKQKKTALLLGCEYGCKDAVEMLLKSGADVKDVDSLGHDAFHYARLSKNQELVTLVKGYLEKEKEAAKVEQWRRQQSVERSDTMEANRRDHIIHDLERQNESLQESLRNYHLEQRALLEKVTLLQQQLTQEKKTVEDTHKEKEQLKVLLSANEREAARGLETVKVQLKSTMGDYSGQSVIKGKENILVKQAYSLDSDQKLQNPAMSRLLSRPLEKGLSGEHDVLRHELEMLRRRQQATEEERVRLHSTLSQKNRECQELVQNRDLIQKQADQQVQELEDALGDVQKRMIDSECKVKQLQAHVVAVKEHLGGQATEELRAQLQDIKAKYEGASAEVGRVRNRLKQSEKALEEYKNSESQLAAEAERLNEALGAVTAERDELSETVLAMETQLTRALSKHGNMVPAEKFDNMKNLLTNAVDEKERQLAELRDDYDRVLEEVAALHQKLDNPTQGGAGAVASEEQQRIQAALEEQNISLKRKLQNVTAKSQALIHEMEESEEEREILQEKLEELNSRLEADFIPIKEHEEARMSMASAVEDLEDKVVEANERFGKAEAQVQLLHTDKLLLQENINNLQEAREKRESEIEALKTQNADVMKKFEALQTRCEDRDKKCAQLTAQTQTLKQSLEGEYVPRQQYEQLRIELTSTLASVKAENLNLESTDKECKEELKNVKEGNAKLQEKLEKVLLEMKNDYMSMKDHKCITEKMGAGVVLAENRANQLSALHVLAKEENVKLTQELEAQKKELDTIMEAIQSKFIPLTVSEEKENSYNNQLKELKVKLLEMEDKYNKEKSERENIKLGKEKLKIEIESVQQRLDTALVVGETRKGYEEEYEAVSLKLSSLEEKHNELNLQKAELEDHNALCNSQIQNLQDRLKSELTRIATYDTELKALHDAMQQAQADCKKAREAQQVEAQKVCALQKEVQELHREHNSLLQQHTKANEALEAEVTELRMALQEEEESSGQRAEDVSTLQSELLQATQALEELRFKEGHITQMKKEKQQLEAEAINLSRKLLSLTEECNAVQQEVTQARERESKARREMDAVHEKGQAIEREIRELKERYDESLGTIGDLQRRIQMSSQLTEAKDKKITELLMDVERLKQALNGLSQLAYTSNAPNKRQTQHMDTLQAQIKNLQQQLAGHMDEDVQAALLQIIRMRQEFVC